MNIRRASVAGHFYPSDRTKLLRTIEGIIDLEAEKEKAISVIAPHAAYMYSGKVAGMVFSNVIVPSKVIIIGPNHTGYGPNASIMTDGVWEMPLGNVNIDTQLAQSIMENSDTLESDTLAHMMEHSLEVQIPFLQYFQSNIEIVPIVLSGHSYSLCESVAEGIASGIKSCNDNCLIVASTDLTHYQPQSIANEQDNKIIEKIQALDAKGLLNLVINEQISMCGYLPVTTAILASNLLGAQKSTLIKYMTSGDISGDLSHVVGYVGMIIN